LLLGYRKDVPRVLKSLDCFLFPSLTEGQPNALIEAMVSEIPIVASDIPSIKECVPSKIADTLKKPLDVQGFKNEILNIFKKNKKQVSLEIRHKFNHNINFGILKKILNE
jgi:glycosyltransferase involved in cell wall biosynthesis